MMNVGSPLRRFDGKTANFPAKLVRISTILLLSTTVVCSNSVRFTFLDSSSTFYIGGAANDSTDAVDSSAINFRPLPTDDRSVDFSYFDVDFGLKRLFFVDKQSRVVVTQLGQNEASPIGSSSWLLSRWSHGQLIATCLSVDWVTQKLYWAVETRIEVADFSGQNWAVVTWGDVDYKRYLTVDPLHGYMFWINRLTNHIWRAWMDGTHLELLIDSKGRLQCLSVDYSAALLYWVESREAFSSDQHAIEVIESDLAGRRQRTVVAGAQVAKTYYMTVFQGSLYWYKFRQSQLHRCGITNCTRSGTMQLPRAIEAFRVWHANAQPVRPANPCAAAACTHICLLTPQQQQQHSCACPTGRRLLSDGATCAGRPDTLLYLATTRQLYAVSLDTADLTPMLLRPHDQQQRPAFAVAVDFDPVNQYLYWTDTERQCIQRARVRPDTTLGDVETIVRGGMSNADGLAVDYVAGNLYWTDYALNVIQVCRTDGAFRRVLIADARSSPRHIVIDITQGVMYWSDWSADAPRIERAALDGTNRRIVVSLQPGQRPNGLALDLDHAMLYFVDANSNQLLRKDLGRPSAPAPVVVLRDLKHPFGLAYHDLKLYWTEWRGRTLQTLDIATNASRVIAQDMGLSMGVRASPLHTSLDTSTFACAPDTHRCQQLCLRSGGDSGRRQQQRCACATGYELQADGESCVRPRAFLAASAQHSADLIRLSLSTPNGTRQTIVTTAAADHTSQPMLIDYSSAHQALIWSSSPPAQYPSTSRSHSRLAISFFNGSRTVPLLAGGLGQLEGLAYDWLAGNIYWSDSWHRRIECGRLQLQPDTGTPAITHRRVLLADAAQLPLSPRAIALHPRRGYVFWIDWSVNAEGIRRADLNGDNVEPSFKPGIVVSLTVDVQQDMLYWVLRQHNSYSIRAADVHGGSERVVLAAQASPISALNYYDGRLLWAAAKGIHSLPVGADGGGPTEVLYSTVDDIVHLVVVDVEKQSTTETGVALACAHGNGGCEALCFGAPDGRPHCACDTHHSLLADGVGCAPPTAVAFAADDRSIYQLKLYADAASSNTDAHAGRIVYGSAPSLLLPVDAVMTTGSVRALQYDPVAGVLYWLQPLRTHTRLVTAELNRIDMLAHTPTLAHCSNVHAIALDAAGRQLLAVCHPPFTQDARSRESSIRAYRLLGGGGGTASATRLVHLGLLVQHINTHPMAVAVDPINAHLFYVDSAEPDETRLIRCSSAGRECVWWRPAALRLHAHATLLVVPAARALLVGTDNALTLAPYDATSPVQSLPVVTAGTNVSVGALGRSVLVKTDRDRLLEAHVDAQGTLHSSYVQHRTARYTTLLLADLHPAPASPTCPLSCAELCVRERDQWTCACSLHRAAAAHPGDCKPAVKCQRHEYGCADGHLCIDRRLLCDGAPDCVDGSDERPYECDQCRQQRGDGGWPCANSMNTPFLPLTPDRPAQCIHRQWQLCDGQADCDGGSDEFGCYCAQVSHSRNDFQCGPSHNQHVSSHCIERTAVCDGISQCADGSDEREQLCAAHHGGRQTNRNGGTGHRVSVTTPTTDVGGRAKGGGVELSTEHLVSYGTLGIMLVCIVTLAVCLCMAFLLIYRFRNKELLLGQDQLQQQQQPQQQQQHHHLLMAAQPLLLTTQAHEPATTGDTLLLRQLRQATTTAGGGGTQHHTLHATDHIRAAPLVAYYSSLPRTGALVPLLAQQQQQTNSDASCCLQRDAHACTGKSSSSACGAATNSCQFMYAQANYAPPPSEASCSHASRLSSSLNCAHHLNASGERVAFVCSGCGAARSPPPPYQHPTTSDSVPVVGLVRPSHATGQAAATTTTTTAGGQPTTLVFYGQLEQQQQHLETDNQIVDVDDTSDSDYVPLMANPPPSPSATNT